MIYPYPPTDMEINLDSRGIGRSVLFSISRTSISVLPATPYPALRHLCLTQSHTHSVHCPARWQARRQVSTQASTRTQNIHPFVARPAMHLFTPCRRSPCSGAWRRQRPWLRPCRLWRMGQLVFLFLCSLFLSCLPRLAARRFAPFSSHLPSPRLPSTTYHRSHLPDPVPSPPPSLSLTQNQAYQKKKKKKGKEERENTHHPSPDPSPSAP